MGWLRGMGWDGMGSDGMGWDGMGWDRRRGEGRGETHLEGWKVKKKGRPTSSNTAFS
jgi:hypothetical protein